MTETVNIADLDCIFLTYDEPRRDEFWIKIRDLVPWAKRVDGVKGSDAAHKAAAAASDTERFILIDGDNLPDPEFFERHLVLDDRNRDCVFRWRARNVINGLSYGNGGISCWTRDYVKRMRTHEASDGRDETQVEFCFDPRYIPMHDIYSTTYINQSPFQAWRAGFREGVKMCLDRGARITANDFYRRINRRNLDYLTIWMSVGADEVNGLWAMLGARAGCYQVMLTDWDYREVQDFDALNHSWCRYVDTDVRDEIHNLGIILTHRLGLNIVNLTAAESKFFKHHQASQHRNLGINLSEVEYMRLGASQDV
jgi:hypothetical protein